MCSMSHFIFCAWFNICLQALTSDIAAHQVPILRSIQDTQTFLGKYGDKLRPNDRSMLQEGADTLKSRYDTVSKVSRVTGSFTFYRDPSKVCPLRNNTHYSSFKSPGMFEER